MNFVETSAMEKVGKMFCSAETDSKCLSNCLYKTKLFMSRGSSLSQGSNLS